MPLARVELFLQFEGCLRATTLWQARSSSTTSLSNPRSEYNDIIITSWWHRRTCHYPQASHTRENLKCECNRVKNRDARFWYQILINWCRDVNFSNQSNHRSLALTALPLSPTKSMDSKTTSRRWALHCTNSSLLSLSPIAIVCWQHRRLNTCICIGWVDKFKYKYSICQLNQYFYKYWDDNANCVTHFIWLDYLHFTEKDESNMLISKVSFIWDSQLHKRDHQGFDFSLGVSLW